jgi:hypothetical protein
METPLATSSVPSGPIVEQNIIDRPGVPAALHDKYWEALGEAGQLGTTARIIVRPDEEILGVDAGLVVSYPVTRDEQFGTVSPVVGPDGVTIIVREIRTGSIRRTFVTPIIPLGGLLVGERLFWWGTTSIADEAPPDPDRGAVWGIDLADSAAEPQQVTPSLQEQFGPGNRSRSPFYVTDGGRVMLSTVGSFEAEATQVIDVQSMSLQATLNNEVVHALIDDVALVHLSESRIGLRHLGGGRRIGPPFRMFQLLKAFAGKDEFFVQYGLGDGSGVFVAAIAADSGESRIVLHQPRGVRTSDLSPTLSTPEILVLLNEDWEYGADGLAYAPMSLLDPVTGELQPDAFMVGSP